MGLKPPLNKTHHAKWVLYHGHPGPFPECQCPACRDAPRPPPDWKPGIMLVTDREDAAHQALRVRRYIVPELLKVPAAGALIAKGRYSIQLFLTGHQKQLTYDEVDDLLRHAFYRDQARHPGVAEGTEELVASIVRGETSLQDGRAQVDQIVACIWEDGCDLAGITVLERLDQLRKAPVPVYGKITYPQMRPPS